MIQLLSPAGRPIVGTLDLVPARANVGGFTLNADGSYSPEFDGGSEMFWNDQRTVEREGQIIVLDEDGEEWPLSACTPDVG